MKLLFENWRKYLKEIKDIEFLNERINSLDSNKRFVNNKLTEVDVEDPSSQFPLSEEELQKIRRVANLDGRPDFLGSGSQGSAWRFGNKVLKITADSSEAAATYLLLRKEHPNVHKIHLTARRDPEDLETLRHAPYIIIYELLDYPNNGMKDVTNNLRNRIDNAPRENKIFYNWKNYYLDEARNLLITFLEYIDSHPEVLEDVRPGQFFGRSLVPKLLELADLAGFDEEQKNLFKIIWTFEKGEYIDSLVSPDNVLEHVREILSSPKTDYLHQLAKGLTWLRKHGITFSDLKTGNVMEKGGQVAIIDIGYSRVANQKYIPTLKEWAAV